jgi:hypothetical protein
MKKEIMKDFLVGIRPDMKNPGLILKDLHGNTNEFRIPENGVILSGRIASQTPNVVARKANGDFYTPILHNGGVAGKVYGPAACEYYRGDGRTRIDLDGCDGLKTLKHLTMPKLISNPTDDQAVFHHLIGFRDTALLLANTTVGSSLELAGYYQSCSVGGFTFNVFIVAKVLSYRERRNNDFVR